MLLMKSITQELAPQRIRVNSLSPGAIRAPMNLEKLTTPESCETLLSLIPCKRIGEAEDVGRAAVWLTSDDSDYVHGGGIVHRRRDGAVPGVRQRGVGLAADLISC